MTSPRFMILALGLTQIIGYGTLYYSFAVLAPGIASTLGIGLPVLYSGFSAALLCSGLAAPKVGAMMDRIGARAVLIRGSVFAAIALALMGSLPGLAGLAIGLLLIEAASLFSLYDAAFAALSQSLGRDKARRAITTMTLLGGFASTLFWPLTGWLDHLVGWRLTLLVFAALHLFICLPLHWTLPNLRRDKDEARAPAAATPMTFAPLPAAQHRRALRLLGISFALSGFVYGAATACWVILLQGMGHATETAIFAGVFMGPAQVAVRLLDMGLGQRLHPVTTALLSGALLVAALLVLGLGAGWMPAALVFAVAFGLSAGLMSIVRGTVPLVLFGADGFGTRLGQLGRLRLVATAIAPVTVTYAITAFPALWTLAGLVVLCAIAQAALLPLRPKTAL